jgi:hypothetical protein
MERSADGTPTLKAFLEATSRARIVILDGNLAIDEGVLARLGDKQRIAILRLHQGELHDRRRGRRWDDDERVIERHERTANLLGRLSNVDAESSVLVNLLPATTEDASAWGMDPHSAQVWAENAARLQSDLRRYGLESQPLRNRADTIAAVKSARTSGKSIVLIGESADDGLSIRIPGTIETLSQSDLSFTGKDRVLAFICGSSRLVSAAESMSVVGRIFTDQTRSLLRAIFDGRDPASAREYFDVRADVVPILAALTSMFAPEPESEQSVIGAARSRPVWNAVPICQAMLMPIDLPTMATMGDPASQVSQANADAGIDPPTVTPDSNGDDASKQRIVVFLVGLLGGCSREVLRWRRLLERRRADLYARPKYLIASLLEIVCGAGAALVFVGLVRDLTYPLPVAFVCGAGFELLVQMAARLSMWTPPVPQGEGKGSPARDSLLEYLRA